MNYIKHLTNFFERVTRDSRLNPTHVSLYVSVFQMWNLSRFKNPVSVSRDELMKISKISAKGTYHKCMRELHNFGYLSYHPSFNPYKGSVVYLENFDREQVQKIEIKSTIKSTSIEQEPSTFGTGLEQACGQLYIKENIINNINYSKQDENKNHKFEPESKIEHELSNSKKEFSKKNNQLDNFDFEKKEKSSAKKEKSEPHNFLSEGNHETNPTLQEVSTFFAEQSFPLLEADKFFNYFQSNGWLVGGKTKMKDWQAAARNWMINFKRFNPPVPTPKAGKLNASKDKDYSEPL